jgi:hypothetical protein
MPAIDISKVNRLGKNFSVELYIGNVDISKFLTRVRMIHTANSVWPKFSISLNISSNDIILNDIYGQETMHLRIYLMQEDNMPVELVQYKLLYLKADTHLFLRPEMNETETPDTMGDRGPVTFTAIPLPSFNTMCSFVNYITEEEDPSLCPVDTVAKIITDLGLGDRLDIDNRGKNLELIPQFICPPMTVTQLISFIDNAFSLYNGPMFRFCGFDGKIHMWNLNEKIKDIPVCRIFQMNTARRDKTLFSKIMDDVHHNSGTYYTRDPIKTLYFGNSSIVENGFNRVFTTHPPNDLYQHFSETIGNIATTKGVFEGSSGAKMHPNVRIRKRYTHNIGGVSNSALATTAVSNDIRSMLGMGITIRRNIRMIPIVKIGNPVDFVPTIFEYQSYRGKYILNSSDFILSRETSDNWDSVCHLTLFRTSPSYFENPIIENKFSGSTQNIV